MLIGPQTVRCSNIEEPYKKLSVATPQLEYCDESHLRMAELSRPKKRLRCVWILASRQFGFFLIPK